MESLFYILSKSKKFEISMSFLFSVFFMKFEDFFEKRESKSYVPERSNLDIIQQKHNDMKVTLTTHF